ncbi:F-box protein At2g27310-like [Rutidosis leptorrhynchoides]|uniref:F-box protein At2g27310-like n=1 Tax=Rutidosis leptorrhynchoides TaxID=125765 RepID=UPI003A98D584
MVMTSFCDIHPDIIQTHILPRLNGQSLSATSAVSAHLHSLCSDHNLWTPISTSTWPSITDPRVHDVISTFPAGHRSFFQDSFPALTTNDVNDRPSQRSDLLFSHDLNCPSQLISAVDIRYQSDVVYSKVEFTDTTTDFLSSKLKIELNDCNGSESKHPTRISQYIGVKVDELAGADEATLSHLKESMELSWIIIDPTRKRAGNISSIKPLSARQGWMTNDTVLEYVTVLPGSDPNEMVQCRIKMVLGVDTQNMGLYVKKVVLKLRDLNYKCLNGREFLVTTQGAISEENNVTRKVLEDDEERWRSYNEIKELKRKKRELVEKEEKKKEFAMNYVGMSLSFCFSVFFLVLSIQ